MSYNPGIASNFNDTKNRSGIRSPQSGMCSFCTADCIGTCELGLSAVLGAQAVYPTNTGDNQVAGEKDYPIDYSHLNISGRVFGAQGLGDGREEPAIYNVSLETTYGKLHPVKMAMPVILPALIKLNWKDYFAGAAMAGVSCVIGEGAPSKDPNTKYENGKVVDFPMLATMLDAFRDYYRGYGQIFLQCNCEDAAQGLPEYAITKHGCEAIEFKFGQSAKGTQPVSKLKNHEAAQKKQAAGGLVWPDPSDPAIVEAVAEGTAPNFYGYGRLPMWDESYLVPRIAQLRKLGLKNVSFKMAGYDRVDLEHVLRIAALADVDIVTFDGAGGGSGYSPCKMMNEWSLPTIALEAAVCDIAKKLELEGFSMPAIVVTGGFATEDQVYKALAMGEGTVTAVGLCRAAMAAANSAKKVGELIAEGKVPDYLKIYGNTVQEIFADLPDLRFLYGKEADNFAPGAIGTFSYLNRIANGLRHFGGLNRKFDIALANKRDLIPLTRDAKELLAGTWFDW